MKLIIFMIVLLLEYSFGKTSSLLRYIFASDKFELKKVRSESEINGDDTVLDFIGLVERHGYPAEEHKVITDDGYILTIHRIPYSPKSNNSINKPVVLMQHGLFASSDSWVFLEPKRSLSIFLADEGYDVWLGNFRGNTYSRSHVNMTTNDPNFWKFSYHDIGLHDIPRSIDYILNYTKSQKLFYIGHSMGTSVSYVMLSMKQSYNDKIRLVISLASVSYFKNKFPPFLNNILLMMPRLKILLDGSGIYNLFPQSKLSKLIGKYLCSNKSIFMTICTWIMKELSGSNITNKNESIIPLMLNHLPAGASTQNVYHYYQNYITGNFEAYDYGYEDNLIHYKTPKPPIYNVKKIIAPVALIYGINDFITNEKDARVLSKKLPNLVTCEAVPNKYFSHIDFLLMDDIKTLLFDRILQLMEDF